MSWLLGSSPKEDGSLPPIIEHVNVSRLWEEELPSFGRSSSALAVQLLWHMHSTACAHASAHRTMSPDTHEEPLVSSALLRALSC